MYSKLLMHVQKNIVNYFAAALDIRFGIRYSAQHRFIIRLDHKFSFRCISKNHYFSYW